MRLILMHKKLFYVVFILLISVTIGLLLFTWNKLSEQVIVHLYVPDNVLNHKRSPGEFHYLITLGDTRINFESSSDADGIRRNKTMPLPSDNAECRILFMGDSFIEGYDDENTVPQYVWQFLQNTSLRSRKIACLNAGCSSYSPLIYIAQAKILLPKLRPDLVVIDIDETDLMDDFIRYKDLSVRDDNGRVIAVKPTPIGNQFISRFKKLKKYPFYAIRAPVKVRHKSDYLPIFSRMFNHNRFPPTLKHLMDNDSEAGSKYAEEIAFFKKNLEELAGTLSNLMGDSKRILFIYHAHRLRLEGDKNGFYGNGFVSAALQETCDRFGISFYDATTDLKNMFKDDPDKYYMPGDSLGHFSLEGMAAYSSLVAKKLLPMIGGAMNGHLVEPHDFDRIRPKIVYYNRQSR